MIVVVGSIEISTIHCVHRSTDVAPDIYHRNQSYPCAMGNTTLVTVESTICEEISAFDSTRHRPMNRHMSPPRFNPIGSRAGHSNDEAAIIIT